jgi:hypothetical protein
MELKAEGRFLPRSKGLAEMARGATVRSAGNGILGVVWLRKKPSGFDRSTSKFTKKVQTKASPCLPPPTLQ